MTKLVCIVGESASGKDTVVRYLRKEFNFKEVCSHTTRPMRSGETNGVEHWFDTKEEFDKLMEHEDNICAYVKLESKNSGVDGYEYCSTLEDIKNADMYVIDPTGIEYMRNKFPDLDIFTIYIHASKKIRKERALKRDPSQEQAFEERYANEHEAFDNFFSNEKYDVAIINERISEIALCGAVREILINEGFLSK